MSSEILDFARAEKENLDKFFEILSSLKKVYVEEQIEQLFDLVAEQLNPEDESTESLLMLARSINVISDTKVVIDEYTFEWNDEDELWFDVDEE